MAALDEAAAPAGLHSSPLDLLPCGHEGSYLLRTACQADGKFVVSDVGYVPSTAANGPNEELPEICCVVRVGFCSELRYRLAKHANLEIERHGPSINVKRVQKGDRVVVPGTPQCGVCYQCLHGRADWCQFLDTAPAHPSAEMSDGTQIFEQAGLGGLSEGCLGGFGLGGRRRFARRGSSASGR